MQRQENQQPRPTAGCLSVPLFNQKKRNRIPLTSAPSENEFFSHREYVETFSSAQPKGPSGGCYQPSGPSSGAIQSNQWNRQSTSQFLPSQPYGHNKPTSGPAPAARTYGLMAHPYKTGGRGSTIGQPSQVKKQDSSSDSNPKQSSYQIPSGSESSQTKLTPGFHRYSKQPRTLPPLPSPAKPSAPSVQPQSNSWKFTNTFEPQSSAFQGKKSASKPQNKQQEATPPTKPTVDTSLRIMTAVIGGMRHWSKYKDRIPYLVELFATLDSAVTLGQYGAKSFLMRDGKEVVQCLFYENDRVLPRLIRGQVHRCVGNYDRGKDLLVCVSVRPSFPSELRNAQEAVKVCDAEMRMLVKSLNEV